MSDDFTIAEYGLGDPVPDPEQRRREWWGQQLEATLRTGARPVEPLGASYADTIGPHIEQLVRQQLRLLHAAEDIAMVRALAQHPWALHWLAGQPEWRAYTASLHS